ncbi:MAG: glycosyltransferase family 2 protein [Chloroflexi bacterium]|nr:MAG: glycosyltransferase family 2 protein [Chloroflexota bacterium]
MFDGKLSLVLPAHNEAENIEAVVGRALEVLPSVTREHEIIVVNDGSKDATPEIIDRLAAEHPTVFAVHHPVNRGYGAALTSGFAAATGDHIMFMDADRQFDIGDIRALLPYVPHYDIVAGYRIKRQDPFYRRLYGKLFGLSVWILFRVHMRDIDCAFKIFRADLLKGMQLTTPGALINTEMLARSKRRGATIVEVGVHHYPRLAGESSGGSPRVVLRAMGETVRLWFRLRREDRTEPALADTAVVPAPNSGSRAKLLAPFAALATLAGGLLFWRKRRQ